MLKILSIFYILFVISKVKSQYQDFYFSKTLEGETLKTDLIPSLISKVSYIQAVDLNHNKISYYINSSYFFVDEIGDLYLISKLSPNFYQNQSYLWIETKASNGFKNISLTNKILVLNAIDRPPEFVNPQQVFEIEEDNSFQKDITFKNGSVFELRVTNLYPINEEIIVNCENVVNLPNSCDVFEFRKNSIKSSSNLWSGTIRIKKKLNYLEKPVYQLIAEASNNLKYQKRLVFEIKVLPSLIKVAQLSNYVFTVIEKQPPNTLVGQLSLSEDYELSLRSEFSFSLIDNSIDLLNNGILYQDLIDVDFELVKKYLYINADNKLLTLMSINRDSIEFENSILKSWVKVFNTKKPNIFSFFKITILILDLNDNRPRFGLVKNFDIKNTFEPVQQKFLSVSISENSIGPLIFDGDNKKYFSVYDLDFGKNSTFSLNTVDIELDSNSLIPKCVSRFNFYSPLIQSKTSLNLVNKNPIDFDDLNLSPYINPLDGIASKILKFNLTAHETISNELYTSEPIQIQLKIQDINDNQPVMSQDTYYAYIKHIEKDPKLLPQLIAQFDIADKDLGIYGVAGLACFLLGDGSDQFLIDTVQKKIFLKSGFNLENSRAEYHLTIICKDNKGAGHIAFASVYVSFNDIYKTNFKLSNKIYYILSTGPSGTEIPQLVIKPIDLYIINKVIYSIENEMMKKLFKIDENGKFLILADKLNKQQSINGNGTFIIPVLMTDLQGNSNRVTIILQLSDLLSEYKCPLISNSVMCKFSINRTSFDANRIRFCFYGSNQIVTNYNNNMNPFYNQIYFSLLPNSPDHLYINPSDGCVKILPSFDLEDNSLTYIKYSVGAFNPGLPDCIYSNQKSCLITIDNVYNKQIKCVKKYQIIDNSTSYRLEAYSPDQNSALIFSILREERTTFTGNYEIVSETSKTYFRIDPNNGLIGLKSQLNLTDYQSVLVVVRVEDLNYLSKSTECLIDFKFCNLNSKSPKFIGFGLRYENLCEDVPVNTQIMSLKSFDPNYLISSKKLCYSLLQNEYFYLKNDIIYLNKKIDLKNIKLLNKNTYLNLTALLFYCNQEAMILNKQIININILNVNKYGPQLVVNSNRVFLSLKSDKNSIVEFDVLDQDSSPYDYFNCLIENDDRFSLINNNDLRKVYLSNKISNTPITYYSSYADLTIKCCDDEKYWTENNCFSVPKCSLSSFRVEFVDFVEPIYCINDQQVAYVQENAVVGSLITNVSCISNFTQKQIYYKLLTNSDYFSIQQTGSIVLNKQLSNSNLENLSLKIECSNGAQTSTCSIDLVVIPVGNYRPKWLFPNPHTVNTCIMIQEDASIGTLLVTVKASVLNQNTPIYYSFVNNGQFVDTFYEFKFKDQLSGQIYLDKKLNTSISIQRELTMVASVKKPSDQSTISVYQYICINIVPPSNYQPCFRTKPNNSKWPYQVNIENSIDSCFYDQIVTAYNKNYYSPPVYYYILPSRNPFDIIYTYFDLDPQTGLVCKKNSIEFKDLIEKISRSAFSYQDELGKICYNLNLFASRIQIDKKDLIWVKYDDFNCAFNYFKICIPKIDLSPEPPVFLDQKCQAIFSLEKLFPIETTILYNFKLKNEIVNKYYELIPINNQFDKSIFYLNNTINSLGIQLASGLNKNFYLGKHKFNVVVKDDFGRIDSITCFIYGVQSCEQKVFIQTGFDYSKVSMEVDKYLSYLSELLSDLLDKKISTFSLGVYEHQDEIFKNTNSLIEASFFDEEDSKFLTNDQTVVLLDSSLKDVNSKSLKIYKISSSCPKINKPSDVESSIGIGLISALFLLMFLIFPFILACLLCKYFKYLQFQDNRIIMKEKIIPIIRPVDQGCSAPCTLRNENSVYLQPRHFSNFGSIDDIIQEPYEQNIVTFKPNSSHLLEPRFGTFKTAVRGDLANKNRQINNHKSDIKEENFLYDSVKSQNFLSKEPIGETGVITSNDFDKIEFEDTSLSIKKEHLI